MTDTILHILSSIGLFLILGFGLKAIISILSYMAEQNHLAEIEFEKEMEKRRLKAINKFFQENEEFVKSIAVESNPQGGSSSTRSSSNHHRSRNSSHSRRDDSSHSSYDYGSSHHSSSSSDSSSSSYDSGGSSGGGGSSGSWD